MAETWTTPAQQVTGTLITSVLYNAIIDNIDYVGAVVEPGVLTNKSGGSLAAGSVVIADASNDNAFTTTATADTIGVIGIVMETIANNAAGRVAQAGAVTVNVQGNVTRGHYLATSTTAGRAADAGTGPSKATVAIALTGYAGGGAGTVTALLLPAAVGGAVIQIAYTETGAVATGTTVMPNDDTVPQNTEGDQYMTLAFTPKKSTSILRIDVEAQVTAGGNISSVVALFIDSIAAALAAVFDLAGGSGYKGHGKVVLTHFMASPGASAVTFKVRAGPATAGTMTFNGAASARLMGGVAASSVVVTEYEA